MTRQTSIDTYHKIEANGLLSKRRWQFYRALYAIGGSATGAEIVASMSAGVCPHNANVHARMGELIDRGCARENGVRECKITNETVIVYELTDELPRVVNKQKSASSRMSDELRWMVTYIAEKLKKCEPVRLEIVEWHDRVKLLLAKGKK